MNNNTNNKSILMEYVNYFYFLPPYIKSHLHIIGNNKEKNLVYFSFILPKLQKNLIEN